jgi:hypothetical protein
MDPARRLGAKLDGHIADGRILHGTPISTFEGGLCAVSRGDGEFIFGGAERLLVPKGKFARFEAFSGSLDKPETSGFSEGVSRADFYGVAGFKQIPAETGERFTQHDHYNGVGIGGFGRLI